jgi:thioesterase domain-containing protein
VIFENSTIQKLANKVEEIHADGVDSSEQTGLLTSLGKHQESNGTVYCIPGVAGLAHTFTDIAKQLYRYSLNVKAFNHLGVLNDEPAFKCITENAEYFVSEIINIQKSGPYIILGHSYGGVIALEVAKILKVLGHKVNLILLDTYFKQYLLQRDFNKSATNEINESGDNVIFTNEGDILFTKKVKTLYQIQVNLFAEYEVNNFGGTEPLCIFAKQAGVNLDKYLTQLSQNGIDEFIHHSVPGNHFSMLKDRGSKDIAKIVSDYVSNNKTKCLQSIL